LTEPELRDIAVDKVQGSERAMAASRAAALFLVYCAFVGAKGGAVVCAQARAPVEIVANVELVQIPVTIFDDKGAVATGLKKSDFRLFEDGIEQRILYFDQERVPVSFVVLADLSSSMTRKIPFVQDAALSLLDSLEEQDQYHDEYSILSIGKRSKLLMPFTTDERDLEHRLPVLLTATNESTSLFDGIWLGVNTVHHDAANKSRAMIIITDGGDNHSRYNLRETRELLEEADVPVFTVMAGPLFELPAIFPPQQKKRDRFPSNGSKTQFPNLPVPGQDYIGPAERRGPHNMKVLTEVTGGGVFTAHDEEDLPRIVRTIGLAVRYRYVLSYKPAHGGESRQHKVVVELNPKEKFRGYSLPYYKRTYHSID
jgi:Ca-activated chloride channel family protein